METLSWAAGLLLWGAPLAAILLTAVFRGGKALHSISITASAVSLATAGFITAKVMSAGMYGYAFLDGLFYIDSVSIIILDIVLFISLMSAIYSIGYLNGEKAHGKLDDRRMKRYYILMQTFIFTMVLALTVRNLGVMWIAIEATTLASAFLVGFNNDKGALEGTWKYVIICSAGIAIALLGVIFLYVSSSRVLGEAKGLDWTVLMEKAKELDSPVLRFAFIFILIGFGTKAGLAPMHTWLPDAHSQAPSPISALLSGVLLNSAMYAIIRSAAIVNRNLGSNTYTGGLLIGAGMLSILAAALFILTQKDYKRLLAYSSIEHMGLISLSVGLFTPAALFAAFYHMISHSLTKSMLFLSAGNVLQKYGTRTIAQVKGILKTLPVTGVVFLLGLFAIGGMPPFSVFASEYNILASVFGSAKDGFGQTNAWFLIVGIAAVLLLAFVFAGIVHALFRMFHGKSAPDEPDVSPGETNIAGAVVLAVLLATVALLGITMPEGLKDLINSAVQTINGGSI